MTSIEELAATAKAAWDEMILAEKTETEATEILDRATEIRHNARRVSREADEALAKAAHELYGD